MRAEQRGSSHLVGHEPINSTTKPNSPRIAASFGIALSNDFTGVEHGGGNHSCGYLGVREIHTHHARITRATNGPSLLPDLPEHGVVIQALWSPSGTLAQPTTDQ
jgi:hypothetical protein